MEFNELLKQFKFNDEDLAIVQAGQKADATDEEKEAVKALAETKLSFIETQAIDKKKDDLYAKWKKDEGESLVLKNWMPLNNQLKDGIDLGFYTKEEYDKMSTPERMKIYNAKTKKLNEDFKLRSDVDESEKLKAMQDKLLAEQKAKQEALDLVTTKESEWEQKYKDIELSFIQKREQEEISKVLQGHAADKEKYTFAEEHAAHTIFTLAKSHANERGIVFAKNESGIFEPRKSDGSGYPTKMDGTATIQTIAQFYEEVGKHHNLFAKRRTKTGDTKSTKIVGGVEVELTGAQFLAEQFAKEQ